MTPAPIASALEEAWLSLASVLSIIVPVRAGSIGPGVHRRVLVLAPHPDDEVAGCAGAIALHRRAGAEVAIAIVTDGRRSRAMPSASEEEVARIRAVEGARAHALLGVEASSVRCFGLVELEPWEVALEAGLGALIARFAPDLIYAPSLVDGHPDHLRAAQVLARVARREQIRIYQVHVPLTPVLTNVAIDTSSVSSEVSAALLAIESQAHSLDRTLRLRRYAARLHGALETAEVFLELSADEYRALHAESFDPPRWFGVRPSATRDAWAYLRGWRARRRIRNAFHASANAFHRT